MHRLFDRWGVRGERFSDPGIRPTLYGKTHGRERLLSGRWQGDPGRYHGDPSLSSADLHTQGVAGAWMRA